MAEYCLNCMNQMDGTHYKRWDVITERDLCEGCGQIKPCVIGFRSPAVRYLRWIGIISLILAIIGWIAER